MKIITNSIVCLILIALMWACGQALGPAIDAELAAQSATARQYRVAIK